MGDSLVLFDNKLQFWDLYIQSSYDDLTNMKNIIYELKRFKKKSIYLKICSLRFKLSM